MDNPLRAVHVAADGTFRFHAPSPTGRLARRVRIGAQEYQSETPIPLGQLVGRTSIVGLAIEIIDGETDAQHIARTAAKSSACIAARGYQEVGTHVLHRDVFPVRAGHAMFREAWRFANGAVTVDLAKAREIVVSKARELRDQKLVESDKEKNRLDDIGTGQQKQELAAYRQALRDLPAKVATEIGTLSALQLFEYRPSLPTPPDGPLRNQAR